MQIIKIPKQKKRMVQVRFDDDVYEKLEKMAFLADTSISVITRIIVEECINHVAIDNSDNEE